MTKPNDLVQFLHARLDEDERTARAATAGPWRANKHKYGAEVYTESGEGVAFDHDAGGVGWDDADFIAEWDPARVLREIDAKRRIVDRYAWLREHGDTGGTAWVLPLLALPYADRPGYRDEWRP
ncbi:DUF6221 family protein [Streptomyces tendae]|uniref:DUF6221 family protein n=1 Tax=Streptomyces tendae TaxID=1932 RepID=UPI0033DD4DE2